MSSVEYESVKIEESTSEKEAEAQKAKPLAMPAGRLSPGDQVRGRVAEGVWRSTMASWPCVADTKT